MKKFINYKLLVLSLSLICFAGCEYDNYDDPDRTFSCQLLYKGKPFASDGNPSRTMFRFYQKGFGKTDTGISMNTKSDGTSTQLLFPEEYWLTLRNYNYPFEIEEFPALSNGYDSVYLDMRGKKNVSQDFHITPYYEISDVSAKLVGTDIVATFKVHKVSGTSKAAPRITNARIYLGITEFVNSRTTVSGSSTVDSSFSGDGTLTVSASAVTFRSTYIEHFKDNAFYRVAIELENTPNYYLFSDQYEITGIPQSFN